MRCGCVHKRDPELSPITFAKPSLAYRAQLGLFLFLRNPIPRRSRETSSPISSFQRWRAAIGEENAWPQANTGHPPHPFDGESHIAGKSHHDRPSPVSARYQGIFVRTLVFLPTSPCRARLGLFLLGTSPRFQEPREASSPILARPVREDWGRRLLINRWRRFFPTYLTKTSPSTTRESPQSSSLLWLRFLHPKMNDLRLDPPC